MGLFDIFSNSDAQNAANAQITALQNAYGQYSNLTGQAAGALGGGYGQAQQQLAGGYGAGNQALTGNIGQAIGTLGAGAGALSGQYGNALQALTGNYGAALGPAGQVFQQGQQGATALGNALGLGGPAGNAQATQAFWNNPAIQSQLDIGSQNVMRNQAATGQLASGATNVDLQNLGQQVASQGWNNYISQLQPYLNLEQGGAQQLGGIYTGLGNQLAGTYTGLGQGLAGISGSQAGLQAGLGTALNQNAIGAGTGAAGLSTNLAQALSGLFQNQAGAAYGTQAGIGNAQASADLANLNASANLWGGLLGVGKAALGSPSAMSGIGNAASSLGGGLQSLFQVSDARAKEDIVPVGKLDDGQNVYRFRYKGSPTPQIGLMAQEVERTVPEAVREIGGLKVVDYGRATSLAAGLRRLAA